MGFFIALGTYNDIKTIFAFLCQEFFYNANYGNDIGKDSSTPGLRQQKAVSHACKARPRSAGDVVCTDPDRRFETDALHFSVDGEDWVYREHLYIVLNKPSGFECSHQPQHHSSVFTLFPTQFIQRGLQCVGRLDQDTTGLLLLLG